MVKASKSKARYPSPAIAADCVVFDAAGRVLLIRRKNEPFRDRWALPGGFMEVGETIEAAALRELKEETGVEGAKPVLIGVYSDPKRDPRAHTVSVAFYVSRSKGTPKASDDAVHTEFVKVTPSTPLAFDHRDIIRAAQRLRAG